MKHFTVHIHWDVLQSTHQWLHKVKEQVMWRGTMSNNNSVTLKKQTRNALMSRSDASTRLYAVSTHIGHLTRRCDAKSGWKRADPTRNCSRVLHACACVRARENKGAPGERMRGCVYVWGAETHEWRRQWGGAGERQMEVSRSVRSWHVMGHARVWSYQCALADRRGAKGG